MKAFLNDRPVNNRQCGECTECCIRLNIPVLNKPENIACQHLYQVIEKKIGCAIYNDRPKPCQEFLCLWRSGHAGGTVHRPDKLGIMLTIWKHNNEYILHVWALKENLLEDDKVRRILSEMGRNGSFVFVELDGKKKLIGTQSDNESFLLRHKINEH